MRRGFTLIELSIVLVVIGLFIGGILVGKSLVEAAQINAVIRQLTQYDVAVNNFHSKFKQLPGDTNLLPHPGNNNGIIVGWNGVFEERSTFLYHLSIGIGLKNSKGVNFQTFPGASYNVTTIPSEDYCPKFNIRQNTSATTYACLMPYGAYNVWYYANKGSVTSNSVTIDPLLAIDIAAIDKKIDDGDSRKLGNVMGPPYMGGGAWGSSTTPSDCQTNVWDGSKWTYPYSLSSRNHACTLIIDIGGSVGMPIPKS